jgi:non-specific serine/threonine protein kinase
LTKENAIAVNRVCQRLDGIPLALELAAARVKHLSVEQIADRLDERFDLLTSGSSTAVPRQQTLRAAIDWSYNLLDPAERSLFCRLGIFAGGFTLDAAEAIVDGSLDLLARLVDKSLFNVTITPSKSYRYRMLESIQQYARIELSKTNDLDGLAQQHVQYYLALAQAAEQNLQGVDQVQWLDRLEEEEENLRAALQWSTERDQQTALQLAIALFWFWERRSYYREGINWLEEILTNENLDTKDSSPQSLTLHAQALWACGSLMAQLGDNKKAVTRLESAVTLFRELLNRKVDREKPETQQGLALALTYLSQALRPLGHNEQARILGEEAVSLVRGINQEWGFAFSLSQLAYIVRDQDGYAAARLLFKESLDFYRRAGDLRGIGDVLSSLGITAHLEGDDLQAEKWLEESLELGRQVGDRYQIGVCLVELAFIAMAHGDDPRAEVLTRESLSLFRGLGHAQGIANALVACAALACRQSAYDRAARMYGIIDALKETVGGIIIRRRGDGYVDLIKKAQDLLGSTLFDTEYALGRSLSTDEALKTALG